MFLSVSLPDHRGSVAMVITPIRVVPFGICSHRTSASINAVPGFEGDMNRQILHPRSMSHSVTPGTV
ncbi:hypothetical protein JZ751_000892 [Albula glossodonta]|uniref:Uncharacterized protein n=1 Tax=Albula glossodonta TaxID=121402 RepID=A0A8T2PXP9_9TELE|nr:hypothetical protein JZ751_000892 [Albula glossodonta]